MAGVFSQAVISEGVNCDDIKKTIDGPDLINGYNNVISTSNASNIVAQDEQKDYCIEFALEP